MDSSQKRELYRSVMSFTRGVFCLKNQGHAVSGWPVQRLRRSDLLKFARSHAPVVVVLDASVRGKSPHFRDCIGDVGVVTAKEAKTPMDALAPGSSSFVFWVLVSDAKSRVDRRLPLQFLPNGEVCFGTAKNPRRMWAVKRE